MSKSDVVARWTWSNANVCKAASTLEMRPRRALSYPHKTVRDRKLEGFSVRRNQEESSCPGTISVSSARDRLNRCVSCLRRANANRLPPPAIDPVCCVRDDTNGQPVIVPDSYCTGHTAGLNGFFFYGGHQYRYYYGSSGSIGQRPFGGTTTAPRGATIKTKSGSTIQRGGLGGKLSGGKGGGS